VYDLDWSVSPSCQWQGQFSTSSSAFGDLVIRAEARKLSPTQYDLYLIVWGTTEGTAENADFILDNATWADSNCIDNYGGEQASNNADLNTDFDFSNATIYIVPETTTEQGTDDVVLDQVTFHQRRLALNELRRFHNEGSGQTYANIVADTGTAPAGVLLADSFDRSDSSDIGSSDGNYGQGGDGIAYSEVGQAEISDGRLKPKTLDSAENAVFVVAEVGQWECQSTHKFRFTASAAARDQGPAMRYIDPDNYYIIRANQGTGQLQLYEKVGGTATLQDSDAGTFVQDTDYTLIVRSEGDTVSGEIRELGLSVSYGGTLHKTATKVALRLGGGAATFDDQVADDWLVRRV